MKKVLILLLILSTFNTSFGQSNDPKPGSYIPAFKVLLTDGKYFTSSDVEKNKPFVLIYFAPDCDHCIVLMDALFKKIHQLDQASILLVTFKPSTDLTNFEKKYQTTKFKNIKVGTEGLTYVLRDYYRLQKTPFTAVYDKKGRLAFSYKNETPVNELLQKFKKL
jgi:thiol-disulfide isomerase/thioredoxin